MNTFGQNIAAFRKNKNLTQEKLAELIGISPQSVSKWENDVSMPDIALLPILADIFSTSIDSLFGMGESVSVSREQIPEKAIDSLLRLIGSQFKLSDEQYPEYTTTISESNGYSTALFTDTCGAVWANADLGLVFRKSPEEFENTMSERIENCRPLLELILDGDTVKVLSVMLKNTTPSSASYISKKCEIPAESVAAILEKLESVTLAMSSEVNFDDTSVKLWRVSSTHKMLFLHSLLILAQKILDGDNYYCYCGSTLWCK